MAILLEGTNIKLFEPQDKFSRLDLNSNFQSISDLLVEHKALIENRARIAYGSYTGAKGTVGSVQDYLGKTFTQPFAAASAGTDRLITLPFKPLLLILSGSRTAAVNWSGNGKDSNGNPTSISLAGTAYQSFRQIVCAGQSIGEYQYIQKLPVYGTVNVASTETCFSWEYTRQSLFGETSNPGELEAVNEVAENEDGTWSALLKAVKPNDILGMTYQWVAFG